MDVKDPSSDVPCKTPYAVILDGGEVLGQQTSENGQAYVLSVNVNLLLLMGTEQCARWITALTPQGSHYAHNHTAIWFLNMLACFLSFESLLNQTGVFREDHALSFLGLLHELMWLL